MPVEIVRRADGMACRHDERLVNAAHGGRNARIGETGDRRGETRQDAIWNTRLDQCQRLFAAPPENERIAALEAQHAAAGAGEFDQLRGDVFLRR